MRGHNICFHRETIKIISELFSIPPLIWSSDLSCTAVLARSRRLQSVSKEVKCDIQSRQEEIIGNFSLNPVMKMFIKFKREFLPSRPQHLTGLQLCSCS